MTYDHPRFTWIIQTPRYEWRYDADERLQVEKTMFFFFVYGSDVGPTYFFISVGVRCVYFVGIYLITQKKNIYIYYIDTI